MIGPSPEEFRAVWTCDACGKGDNATRYHNKWLVTIDGETDVPGERAALEGDESHFEFDVCDGCSRKPITRAVLMQLAASIVLLEALEP